jgi:hypothetical protein
MRRLATTLFGSLWLCGEAVAGPILVWLEPQVPEQRLVRRAESDTGEVSHLAHVDLAFPPMPANAEDDRSYDTLRAAVVDGRARWQDWDVEAAIAAQVTDAIDGITVVRSERELRDLADAHLLAGAAVSRAFNPSTFAETADAERFRAVAPGGVVNRPWYDAIGLDPERPWARSDVADGSPFPEFSDVLRDVGSLPAGTVDLSRIPPSSQVYIDGALVEHSSGSASVRPGRHWFHVVRNGGIAGRGRVDVPSGRSVPAPLVVDDVELAEAKRLLVEGFTGSLPDDVKAAIDALARAHRGGVFLGAVDGEGRVVVRPYRNAELIGSGLFALSATGEVGFGLVASPLFDDANGEVVSAPGAHGGLGLEVGVSHAALMGGLDVAFLPTQTLSYGNKDGTENVHASVLPQPWLGAGVYVLRPNKPRTTLLIGGTWTFDAPAHRALGARVSLGLPVDEKGTWFRLTIGGNTAGNVVEPWRAVITDKTPMSVFFARIGFASKF